MVQNISPRQTAINAKELVKSTQVFITECIQAEYPIKIFQKPVRYFSTMDDRWKTILKQLTAIKHGITTMCLGISQKLKRVKYKNRN